MLSLLATTALAFSTPAFDDPCAASATCTDCIAKVPQGCGWCAPSEVIYSNGKKGNRCASVHDPNKWFCLGKLQTDQCLEGYVCTGAPDYKCQKSGVPGEGTPEYSDCVDGCVEPRQWKCDKPNNKCIVCDRSEEGVNPACMKDSQKCEDSCVVAETYKCDHSKGACAVCDPIKDDPASCFGKGDCDSSCAPMFQCDIPLDVTKGEPQCKPCADPTGKSCFKSEAECKSGDGKTTFGCDWKYECKFEASGPTCAKAANGIPKKEWCDEQCVPHYQCDEVAGMCKLANSTSGSADRASCEASCDGNQTKEVPVELIGVWRGLAIQQSFVKGEWVANVSAHAIELLRPDGTVYFSGKAGAATTGGAGSQQERRTLTVHSTEGELKGKVTLLYGEYDLAPELQYLALAVDESAIETAPPSFDAAMPATAHRVLGMTKCKSDAKNCAFHLISSYKTHEPIVYARGMSYSFLKAMGAGDETGDECNQFASCDTCIESKLLSAKCGWCSEDVVYPNATAAKARCAGWAEGKARGWVCYGQFRTESCTDWCCNHGTSQCEPCAPGQSGMPTKELCEGPKDAPTCGAEPKWFNCSLDGLYRGLQIDLGYLAGEWTAAFAKATGKANFTFLPTPASGKAASLEGRLQCRPRAGKTTFDQEGEFKLTLADGSARLGLYSAAGDQAETTGLALALAEKGSTVPPATFDAAMLGTNATMYAYTKCASYKKGVCLFH